MKRLTLFLSILLCLILLVSCGHAEPVYTAGDVAGKVYTYEKDGVGGAFTIRIFEDGTFQYYEGMLSSYIGMGTWTLDENNTLCMKDQEMGRFSDDFSTMEMYVRTNYFRVEENALVWLRENSDNFLYVDVEAGDRFLGEPMHLNASSFYSGVTSKTKELISLEGVRQFMLLCTGYSAKDRVGDLLEGFTCDDLVEGWGEPDSMTSGIWSYAWDVDETCTVWVVFDKEGYVSEVQLKMKE